MTRDELIQNVQTIVIVMMENRSFDHVLGHLRHPDYGNRADVEGIEDLANPQYQNPNSDGVAIAPFWMADGPFTSDLPHGPDAVHTQLAPSKVTGTDLMNGFVQAYEAEFHTSVDQPPVMGLLRPGDLPVTAALAAHYTVCDHWFACLPTSTAPNRLMSMCGYTTISDTGTVLPSQSTVYDWLSVHGVRWRVYSAGLPFLMLMPNVAPLLLTTHFRHLDDLRNDVANEAATDWPQVIFIEPDYYDCPVHLAAPCPTPCDNHAPLAMAPGESFLRVVYQYLTTNAAKWGRTVLIVTYDEHGGFFDHVAPPAIAYRNGAVSFDSAGVRVPTIVAGPFTPRGGVCHTPLDNTSILQLLAERFGQPGETYSSPVAARAGTFASVSAVLSAGAGNAAVAPIGAVAAVPAPAGASGNANMRASFDGAIKNLVGQHQVEAVAKYPTLKGYGS